MENKKTLSKKNVGGILLDIFTIGMLFASFAALFYSGFILKTETFPLIALCAITAVGLLLLFFIGTVSCLSSKSKNKSLTLFFLIFSAVQLVALIVNIALLFALLIKMFSVDGLFARLTYLITVAVVLIGYVASISYFSDGNAEDIDDGEEEYEDEADEADEADEVMDSDEASEADEAVNASSETDNAESAGDNEESEKSADPAEPEELSETESDGRQRLLIRRIRSVRQFEPDMRTVTHRRHVGNDKVQR